VRFKVYKEIPAGLEDLSDLLTADSDGARTITVKPMKLCLNLMDYLELTVKKKSVEAVDLIDLTINFFEEIFIPKYHDKELEPITGDYFNDTVMIHNRTQRLIIAK
jgi:hypothetical protein